MMAQVRGVAVAQRGAPGLPAVLEPMVFGGALAFLRAESSDVEVTLDRALTLDELTTGTDVSGTSTSAAAPTPS